MRRRLWFVAILLGVATSMYVVVRAVRHKSKSAARRHQEELVELHRQLPKQERAKADAFLSRLQPDWHKEVDQFAAEGHKELNEQLYMAIQVAVEPALKPVPIRKGQFQPLIPQPSSPDAPPLTGAQQNTLERAAASVGRMEVRQGLTYSLEGTAFVVGPGRAATNCHVIRQVASPGATPDLPFTLAPQGDLLIDFGDGPQHDPSHEFEVISLDPCPGKGLDVAFVEVQKRSVDRSTVLPAFLVFIPSTLPEGKRLIGEIGFPDLDTVQGGTPTQDLFKQYINKGYSKFYTPGAITSVKSVSGVDFLYHVTSTWPGESGSPMFDLASLNIIGVDACCDRISTTVPALTDLKCASRLLTSPANIGIASWTVLADPVLGPLLPKP